jgi:hypothetical protein
MPNLRRAIRRASLSPAAVSGCCVRGLPADNARANGNTAERAVVGELAGNDHKDAVDRQGGAIQLQHKTDFLVVTGARRRKGREHR